jgi:hypothetical protein
MAWSGVGQLDSTLSEQQVADSLFVSWPTVNSPFLHSLTVVAVVLCVSGVLVFYSCRLKVVPRIHTASHCGRDAMGQDHHLQLSLFSHDMYWWDRHVPFLSMFPSGVSIGAISLTASSDKLQEKLAHIHGGLL